MLCWCVLCVGWERSLENFVYSDTEVTDLIHSIMNNTEFDGVSV